MEINMSVPEGQVFGAEELAALLHKLNMGGKGPSINHYYPEDDGHTFEKIRAAILGGTCATPLVIEVLQTETDGDVEDAYLVHVTAVFLSDGTARVFSEEEGFLVDFKRDRGGDSMLSLAQRGGEAPVVTWFEAIASVVRSYASMVTMVRDEDKSRLEELVQSISQIRMFTGEVATTT